MSRRYAIMKCSTWADPDWCALSVEEQRLYELLVQQAHLSLVGTVDLMPARWARKARDTEPEDIERALRGLEAARFVVVDRACEEVMLRTFLMHDVQLSKVTTPTVKGIWSAWEAVESRSLREQIVVTFPDALWEKVKDGAPAAALEIRRSRPLEREPDSPFEREPDSPLEREVSSRSGGNSTSRPSFHKPLSIDRKPQPTESPAPARAAPALDATARQQRLEEAVELLTDRHLAVTPSKTNAASHRKAVCAGKLQDYLQAGHEALLANPNLNAVELAELLEPPPDPPPISAPTYQRQEQERLERKEREDARLKREAAVPGSSTRIEETIATTRGGLRRNGTTP